MWERWGMAEVLFVCTGNLCRSPSAALLLRQQLGDTGGAEVEVHSAGTVEADSFGSPRALVQEGRAFGIDLGAHVPRMVEPGMIEAADLVVGLTTSMCATVGRGSGFVPEDLHPARDHPSWEPHGGPWRCRRSRRLASPAP